MGKAHASCFSLIVRAEAFSEASGGFGLHYTYHPSVTGPTLTPRQARK